MGIDRVVRSEILPGRHHQPLHIEEPAATPRFGRRHTLVDEHGDEQIGDAGRGRPGAEEEQALGGERPARQAQRRNQSRDGHRRSALNIVVERRQPIAMARQQGERIFGGKVLELQQGSGKHFLNAADEFVEQLVIRGPAQPPLPHSQIERIGAQRVVLGPHVQCDRQARLRRDACARRVERELAARDPHSVGAQVAESEDPLSVGHHDRVDLGRRPPVPQEAGDASAVVARNIQAARLPVDVAI